MFLATRATFLDIEKMFPLIVVTSGKYFMFFTKPSANGAWKNKLEDEEKKGFVPLDPKLQ